MRKIALFVLVFLLINQTAFLFSQKIKPATIYKIGWIDLTGAQNVAHG